MAKSGERHSFAFFYGELAEHKMGEGQQLALKERALVHRVGRIVRARVGDLVTLFDDTHVLQGAIDGIDTDSVILRVQAYTAIEPLTPSIIMAVPLLERQHFEQVIYASVELGANEIHLIETDKSRRRWGGQRDRVRCLRIMRAAAEQSKQFFCPPIRDPEPLDAWCSPDVQNATCIFFDRNGTTTFELMTTLHEQRPQLVVVLVGPEGDLTEKEKNQLVERGFYTYELTPTVLRAHQAATLGLGFVRAIISGDHEKN